MVVNQRRPHPSVVVLRADFVGSFSRGASHSFAPLRNLTGPLALNALLDGVETIALGNRYAPETLRLVNNETVYATVKDHGLVRVDLRAKRLTSIGRIGTDCGMVLSLALSVFFSATTTIRFSLSAEHDPEVCGQLGGFDAITNEPNTIIVADAYHGIWSIDAATGAKTVLVTDTQWLPADDGGTRRARLFNAVATSKRTPEHIYWTDSTSDFRLQHAPCAFFVGPVGRLFRLDRRTGANTLLADRLHYANGVVLSPDEEFVLVSESAASQIRRVYIAGARAGTSDVFVAGLPGAPDNLSADADGVWVALSRPYDGAASPAYHQLLGAWPVTRYVTVRMITLTQLVLRAVNVLPCTTWAKRATNWVGSWRMFDALAPSTAAAAEGEATPSRATIVRLSWSGEIVGAAHGTTVGGLGGGVTMAEMIGGRLYLGSGAPVGAVARLSVPKW